jgi:hypothetical protein
VDVPQRGRCCGNADGIGFSIIIGNAAKRGANGFRIFYRRMTLLLVIGLLHFFFLWSGDISNSDRSNGFGAC